MEESEITVLCITGWCRNGSTIIGNILNEAPGVFHVGELHFLWKNSAGRGANSLCGCGAVLTECPIWADILPVGRPAGMSPADYADLVIARQRGFARTRHTWQIIGRGLDSEGVRQHAELMSRVYRAIAQRTGARVIVDTTKIPGEAALLPHLDGVHPVFVHLVRDPVAVAHSWRAPKGYVYTMSASRSTAYWRGFNLASRAILRRYPEQSTLLRYEDFIADPAATIAELLRRCDVDPSSNPVDGRTVQLHTNHTVTGNPDRFRTGATVIRPHDDSWTRGLPRQARLAAMLLSWPMSWRYGYRHRGGLRVRPRPVQPAAAVSSQASSPNLGSGGAPGGSGS
ncbi:MAG TPA: sulfotransferase [Jatrophihabitans sp.]|uniref:sulfotransferase n=1 Tax=Jatrophihabitans sp. TaxID=1932789 RepID=UPI002F10AC6C